MANYGGTPGGAYNTPPPPQRPTAPPSVLTAVKLMYAGAALSVVSVVVGLTQTEAIRKTIVKNSPTLTDSQVNLAVNFTLVFIVFISVVGVALWLWMASANKKGRPWGRVVSSVLFGLNTLGLLYTVVAGGGSRSIQKTVGVVGWLVSLGAVVFLWRPDSSGYFNAP